MPDQNAVLDAIVTKATSLALEFDGAVVPVLKRKFPKRRQDDPETLIIVCPSQRADEIKRHTSKLDRFLYYSTIAVIGRSKDDALTSLPALTAIRDALKDAFKAKPADLLGLDDLRDVRAAGGRMFDRALAKQNYEFQSIEVTIDIVAARA